MNDSGRDPGAARNRENVYEVSKLDRGTVIDHLRAGTAVRAASVLRLPPSCPMMLGVNLESERLGRKDIIKIRHYELSEEEAAKVALISPDATLSIIRDFSVAQKIDLHPPIAFRGLIRCTNDVCITHSEGIRGRFFVASHDPVTAACEYCGRHITADHFEFEKNA